MTKLLVSSFVVMLSLISVVSLIEASSLKKSGSNVRRAAMQIPPYE